METQFPIRFFASPQQFPRPHAEQAQDSFGRLLGGSLILTFFIYVFVNVGMVSGMLPVVGLPLPLISYGGTSLVTVMGRTSRLPWSDAPSRAWPLVCQGEGRRR